MSYCEFCMKETIKHVHRIYHDEEYGFPLSSDNELFGRLILEINQAGLSWETILNKKENFRRAYANFEIEKVAAFSVSSFDRLMEDKGIVRNRLKINAAIHNAQQIVEIKQEFGTFKQWLDHFHPLTIAEWTKLFKKTFKFVGGEIVNEFLMSTGYLIGAHDIECPVYKKIERLNPKWKEL